MKHGSRVPLLLLGMLLAACGDNSDPASASADASTSSTSGHDASGPSDDDTAGATQPQTEDTGSASSSETGGTGSSGEALTPEPTPWVWDLPQGFPMPIVPDDNPMTVEKVELGRHLFYDERLSVDGSFSCATCHEQHLAFTDGRAHAEGVTGQLHPRSSMPLGNVAYQATLAWANPELLDLETHALGPMFGTDPVELGLVDEADVLARIADEPRYDDLFAAAWPDDDDPRSLHHVTQAIASFQRSLVTGNSPFDRWFYGQDEDAVDESVKRGWDVFNFPGECTYCHFSFNFTNATYFEDSGGRPFEFHNTALYNEDGDGAYPAANEGLFNFTGEPEDMGRFKSPTLRNVAVTAPYMHDGSIETLEEVLEHYEMGGRIDNPHVDFRMKSFQLTDQERADLLALMNALTDDEFLTDPAHGNPW